MSSSSWMIQYAPNNINTRVTIAALSPTNCARLRISPGRLDARIVMKMMLSIPSTISRIVRVDIDNQTAGSVKNSIIYTS
ncbi:unannotated protein [freshwater metagenome]|uniref:Unannotated protein n=1 Tax=freshwater metagenome TaxID=449393 RepID=A0A6J6FFV5_9ZZZZ